jgi:hypothetical protein
VGCAARNDGAVQLFDLRESRVKLVPASAVERVLPGEKAPTLPSFVGYAVAVSGLDVAQKLLDSDGFSVRKAPIGGVFVPSGYQ